MEKGQVLGSVTVSYQGKEYGTLDLVALNAVERDEWLYRASRVKAFFGQLWVKLVLIVLAALALAASSGLAFLYRSVTGQMYYRTVASYAKTISGFLLAFAVTAIGTLLWQHFFIKFALVGVILFIYCTLYRAQLTKLWAMGMGILRSIFHKK